ncbi:MAG TPA: MDR family MFS transporter [Nocardioides sp.]|jgi:EmrB/QacA subfamily drug resistance transporter|uniref:MDR family MFS transporter n=1 Tax=Nocardioides sp. TaxID=35761 RepID=UPI002E318BFD|nr:MDR family MFS transporter [Nocardioides sp.]HEX3931893.1 MDR family MFS transporter [Nocardioides sp.]
MSTPQSAAASSAESGEYTHRQILTIITGLMMGMFLGALDQTIVSTAIRTIADDLDGLSVQAWVTTAYLITSTIATPIYGKLGDIYGRKKLFMFAITVFIGGSALCSFATSMYMLAAFRAVQGIGAGGLFTLVLAIIGDIVSPRERARYTGYFMATFGTSSVLGPVVGGFFASHAVILGLTGWRWVFLVNVPIGIAALFVVYRTLHVHHHRRDARIDWWGAVALVVALVPLLTIAEQGRDWGWESGRAMLCYVVGVIGLGAFYAVERRMGDNAMIPLRMFGIRPVAVGIGANVITGMALFGGILVLPLYMQIVHGASPMRSGFLMLPMVVGMMSASIISGQIISRTGRIRAFPIFGSALAALALLALSRITADTALPLVMALMLVLGYGLGNCMQPLLLILQSAVPPRDIGVATASATFFRQIGGTIGVAVFLSVLFGQVGGHIGTALHDEAGTPAFQHAVANPVTPLDKQFAQSLQGHGHATFVSQVNDDSSFIGKLSPALAHPFKVGFAQSMDIVFLCAGLIGLVAFLILLLMPKVELRATSAGAAVRSEAAPTAPVTDQV